MEHALAEVQTLRSHEPRLRITRRGRVVVVFFVSILLAGVLAFAAMLGAVGAQATSEVSQTEAVEFEIFVAEAGDTFWGLAQSIAPGADPRDVIADIVTLNQLQGADLHPGQELAIPLKYQLD